MLHYRVKPWNNGLRLESSSTPTSLCIPQPLSSIFHTFLCSQLLLSALSPWPPMLNTQLWWLIEIHSMAVSIIYMVLKLVVGCESGRVWQANVSLFRDVAKVFSRVLGSGWALIVLVPACQRWAMLPLTHGWAIKAHQHWIRLYFWTPSFKRFPLLAATSTFHTV